MSLRTLTIFVVAIIILCYPFAIFFGLQLLSIKWLSLLILCLFALRFTISTQNKKSIISKNALVFISGIGVIFSFLGAISQNILFIKLYPVVMNLGFLCVFASSLFAKETIIYQFAQKTSRTPLPKFAKTYTHKVTIMWCIFFGLNALISCYTALFSSLHIWTIYNGFIVYILIGLLFTVEFLVRSFIKRKHTK